MSASSIFWTSWLRRRVLRPTSAIVLFLSSDIFALHLCFCPGGLPLLFCPPLHGANIGHCRLSVICFGFSGLCLRHTLLGGLGEGIWIIFLGRFRGFGLCKCRLHIHTDTPFEKKRLLVFRGREMVLPVLALVEVCQLGSLV